MLIAMNEPDLEGKKQRKIADIFMPERKIENRREEELPDKPDKPEEPPPNMETPKMDDVEVESVDITMASPRKEKVELSFTGVSETDGEFLPIVKVAPIYPRRAQSRGVEGYCTVQYTVTKSGSVANPQAVDCQPKGYFERASQRAALKFKYKPRVIDGQAVDVPGVRNRFTYELEK